MATTDATCIDIITRSMRFAGILAAGESPSPEDTDDVFAILNGMVDAWTIEPLFIYNVSIDEYALTSGQQDYEIGPTATAPFDVERPARIDRANLIFSTQTPNVRIPLTILDDDGWMSIPVPGVTAGTPVNLYYSRSYPNGLLRFWPKPAAGYSVELEVWTQLTQFADVNTEFSFPPGYYEMIYQNLGLRLCTPEYGIMEVPQTVGSLAAQSRARVANLNQSPPPQMMIDPGCQGVNNRQGYRNLYNPAPLWVRGNS